MDTSVFSSREFNQDTSRVKKAALSGPVFITDRGKPTHVLLSIDEYRRLTCPPRGIADALAMLGIEDVAFETPRMNTGFRAADFS